MNFHEFVIGGRDISGLALILEYEDQSHKSLFVASYIDSNHPKKELYNTNGSYFIVSEIQITSQGSSCSLDSEPIASIRIYENNMKTKTQQRRSTSQRKP
jgi:hypothetical protein